MSFTMLTSSLILANINEFSTFAITDRYPKFCHANFANSTVQLTVSKQTNGYIYYHYIQIQTGSPKAKLDSRYTVKRFFLNASKCYKVITKIGYSVVQ